MHSNHIQGFVGDAILLLIIIAYNLIAIQFWYATRHASNRRVKRALRQLIGIFVFCSFCGYLPRIIDINDTILMAAHILLAVCAWAYVATWRIHDLFPPKDGYLSRQDKGLDEQ